MNAAKDNRVLKKLISLFLLITLPLIIVSSIALFTSSNRLEKEILQSIYEKSQGFITVFDSKLSHISQSTASVTTHSKLLQVSYISHLLNNYEKSVDIAQFREYISNIESINPYIGNIKVYVKSLLRAYNADGYPKGSTQVITEEEYNQLILNKSNSSTSLFYDDDRLIMLFLSSVKNPANMVEVEFSLNKIKKDFAANYENAYYIFKMKDALEFNNIPDEGLKEAVLAAKYENGIAKIRYDHMSYHAFNVSSSYIPANFIQLVPDEIILQPLQLSVVFSIAFFIVMFICISIFFLGAIRLIHNPLTKLVHAFESVQKGDLTVRIQELEKNEFSYLYSGFNEMSEHLHNLIDEVYNQDLLLQQSELKQLQSQINPHFLYNSFFMLQRMMKGGMQEDAIKVSKELGTYFKYITRNPSDIVDLKDEYEHAKIYSNIQAMRFAGSITIEFGELPTQYENFFVPRLILQPIIENAFNHGLENKMSDGLLRVQFIPNDSFQNDNGPMNEGILIIIEDNGDELKDEQLVSLREKFEQTSGIITDLEITGILNIYKRIQIFYKNESRLKVSRSELGGMKVEICLLQRTKVKN